MPDALPEATEFKPLRAVSGHPVPTTFDELGNSAFYADVVHFFTEYPARSLMSNRSRAILFSLIKILRPTCVAEIGTYMAGTTEVLARACWENGHGTVLTTDPFGGDRCPGIIAQWPSELQAVTEYHALNSMDFFNMIDRRRTPLDLVLVDGNHDYEFAIFDLQMAARHTRPSGIVVMDNAEQSGPFHAARNFLTANPTWRELGTAVAEHDAGNPFNAERSSVEYTTFVILQAPPFYPIGPGPHSSGNLPIETQAVAGLSLELARPATGTLHYQVILRAFFKDRIPIEMKMIGAARIVAERCGPLQVPFPEVLRIADQGHSSTVEVDLSWQGDDTLALAAPPAVVGTCV